MAYVLPQKLGCFARAFELQPGFEWEDVFGASLATSDQNKHKPQSDCSLKSSQSIGKGWIVFQWNGNRFWSLHIKVTKQHYRVVEIVVYPFLKQNLQNWQKSWVSLNAFTVVPMLPEHRHCSKGSGAGRTAAGPEQGMERQLPANGLQQPQHICLK